MEEEKEVDAIPALQLRRSAVSQDSQDGREVSRQASTTKDDLVLSQEDKEELTKMVVQDKESL